MLDEQRISLDISKQPTPQQVRLGQGDANATRLIVDIFDDGTAYSLAVYSVRLEMRLPESDSYYSTNGTSSGNTATFEIDETYAATSYGFNGFGYVDVLDGDTVICSTSRFQLVVLRNAQDGADPSTAYSNGIIEATERANEAAEAAEGVILQAVPTMSQYIKGGAKLGEGLTVEDETLSLDGESYTTAEKTKLAGIEDNANNYSLPTMGASTKGGAKLGEGLEVANDVLSLGAHEHSADDITSGVLPVDRGGTGSGTASGAAANIIDGQAISPSSVAASGAVSGNSVSDSVGTMAQLRQSIAPVGSFNVVVSFSSVKSGSYYHATWQLPLGNNYASVSASVISQVGTSSSPITTSDITSRILSANTVDIYTGVDAAAGKAFLMTLTLA